MTTYNGMKYICELLESILKQTIQPDEVVVFDDCSTDGTFDFLKMFVKNNNLYNWHVFKNDDNCGWRKNFRKALEKTTGDFIFICDQDDVWDCKKVENEISAMQSNKKIELLASNYKILNTGQGRVPKIRHFKGNNKKIVHYHKANNSLDNLRPGCTFCISKELKDFMLSHDDSRFAHDGVLWSWALLRNSLYIFKSEDILYRRHDETATGNDVFDFAKRIQYLSSWLMLNKFICSECIEENDYISSSKTMKNIMFLNKRIDVLEKRNFLKTLVFIAFNFHRYPTIGSALSELVFVLKGAK